MAHDHSHGDRNAYYLNQLFTIAVCGALGGVAVMLWYSGKLSLMLHPKFYIWVLLGGLTLLTLVVIRAFAVWRSVDEASAVPEHTHDHDHEHCGHDHGPCHHDHDHGHEHSIQPAAQTPGVSAAATPPAPLVPAHHHDHGHGHDHDHGHDHEHGWAPWRYVVLLLPVVLFFLNLPNQGFSGGADISEGIGDVVPTQAGPSKGKTEIGFAQLQQASLTAESRDYYADKSITLVGKYVGNNPKRFTLERYKIACCAADAVRLDAVIMLDPSSKEKIDPDQYRNKWVEVTGRIHFINRPGTKEYLTSLILNPTADEPLSQFIREIPPPSNQFLN